MLDSGMDVGSRVFTDKPTFVVALSNATLFFADRSPVLHAGCDVHASMGLLANVCACHRQRG